MDGTILWIVGVGAAQLPVMVAGRPPWAAETGRSPVLTLNHLPFALHMLRSFALPQRFTRVGAAGKLRLFEKSTVFGRSAEQDNNCWVLNSP